MNLFDLTGKVAVITGGSKGIGFALSEGLARAGASVVIASRNAEVGQRAIQALLNEGLSISFLPADISKLSSIRNLFDSVLAVHGKIDILVNNAALIIRKTAKDYTEEDWDHTVDTNLKGTFFCCQLAAQHMETRGGGKIINISSVLSQMCQNGRSVYSVTKAGIMHMTKALALEWGPYGINVNSIGPGCTLTDLNSQHFNDHPDELNHIVAGIPLGRPAKPDDMIGAVLFLASSASDYVSGHTLLVDGGMIVT